MTVKQPSLIFSPPIGFHILRGWLSAEEQRAAVEKCRQLCRLTPLYAPRNKYAEFKLRINSFGQFGWHSDENGYRYLSQHPHKFCCRCRHWFENQSFCPDCGGMLTKRPFLPVPEIIRQKMLDAAHHCRTTLRLETVLVNYYSPDTGRLGKHRDDTEENLTAPIITISLGDDAIFGIGGNKYEDACDHTIVSSGDCVVMSGAARLAYHEVCRIYPGTSDLLPKGGRISLTGRQVKN